MRTREVVGGGIAIAAAAGLAWLLLPEPEAKPLAVEPAAVPAAAPAVGEPAGDGARTTVEATPAWAWLRRWLSGRGSQRTISRPGAGSGGGSPPEGTVRGLVLDEADRPVAGAEVYARYRAADRRARAACGRVATTDADGAFMVESPPSYRAFRAKAPGLVSAHAFEPERGEVRVLVVRAVLARVHVADAAGSPVAGAQVVARTVDVMPWEATTDARGRADLPIPRSAGDVRVTAASGPYAPGSATVPVDGDVDVRIVLDAGGTLRGTVLAADGSPAAGVHVTARGPADYGDSAESDARGEFLLQFVPSRGESSILGGDQAVRLFAKHGELAAAASVDLPPVGGVREVSLRLPARRPLRGRVVDVDGAPLEGATVALSARGSQPSAGVATDAQGEFELVQVCPGLVFLEVRSRGGGLLKHDHPVEVAAAGPPPFALIVVESAEPRTGSLAVTVLDDSGRPVEGARVSTDPPGRGSWPKPTESDGTTVATDLPRRSVAVMAHARSSGEATAVVDLSAQPSAAVTLRLGTGAIAGVVVRPDGSPARALVSASPIVLTPDSITGRFVEASWGPANSTSTDAQGRFRLEGLAPVAHVVWFGEAGSSSARGHGPVQPGAEDLRLVLGHPPSANPIEVEVTGPPPRRRDDVGRWTDDFHFTALEGVEVTLARPDAKPIQRLLLPDSGRPGVFVESRFRWAEPPIEAGEYEVTVRLGSGSVPVALGRQRLGPGLTRWRVTRSFGATIEGRVLAPDGSALAGVQVLAGGPGWPFRGENEHDQSSVTDETGAYALSGLRDGSVEVRLRPSSDSLPVVEATRSVVVSTGTPTRLDWTAEVGGAVELWLREGAILREAFALRLTGPRGDVRELRKDAETVAAERHRGDLPPAPWRMEGLAPGVHRVELAWDGVDQPVTRVEVRVGEATLLALPSR